MSYDLMPLFYQLFIVLIIYIFIYCCVYEYGSTILVWFKRDTNILQHVGISYSILQRLCIKNLHYYLAKILSDSDFRIRFRINTPKNFT